MNSLSLEETIRKKPGEDGLAPQSQERFSNEWKRFKFQAIYPSQNLGNAFSAAQADCIVSSHSENPHVHAALTFLHPVARIVGVISARVNELGGGLAQSFQSLNEIAIEGRRFRAGREAIERELRIPSLLLHLDSPSQSRLPFRFYASRELEPIRNCNQQIAGAILRSQEGVEGVATISAEPIGEQTHKLSIIIQNQTRLDEIESKKYDAVLLRSLVSVRISLRSTGVEFISSREYAAQDLAV